MTGGRPSVELSNYQFLTNHSRTRILAMISTGGYVRGVSASPRSFGVGRSQLITFDWVAPKQWSGVA